jgi:hypothetical protein
MHRVQPDETATPILSYQTPTPPTRPTSLLVVSWLFIAIGILCAIAVLWDAVYSHVNINLGVLGIFIGRGLLRLSRGWRTTALALLWLNLIFIPVIIILFICIFADSRSGLLSRNHFQDWMGVGICAVYFGGLLWIYRILVSPEVRRAFGARW